MSPDDINLRFQVPVAPHLIDGATFERVREGCRLLAHGLNDMLPDGHEKRQAMTRLEEVMFWSHAAVTRAS